jgi:hypothetical protein
LFEKNVKNVYEKTALRGRFSMAVENLP